MRALPWILAAVLLTLLASCRGVRYVTLPAHRTDSVYVQQVRRDSIHVSDSVTIRTEGDTVWRDRWHIEYRDRTVHDTVYEQHTDTVYEPYPVEKELSRWESLKVDYGGKAMGLLAVVAAVGAAWLVRRIRKG